jgi:hypothetical protein
MEKLYELKDRTQEIVSEYPHYIFAGFCILVLIIFVYLYGDVYYGTTKEKISDIEDEIKDLIKDIYKKQKANLAKKTDMI